jgi:hypothetical protein
MTISIRFPARMNVPTGFPIVRFVRPTPETMTDYKIRGPNITARRYAEQAKSKPSDYRPPAVRTPGEEEKSG